MPRQRYQFTQEDKYALNLVADECSKMGASVTYLDDFLSEQLNDPLPWVENSATHWVDAAIKFKSLTGEAILDPSSIKPVKTHEGFDEIFRPGYVTKKILKPLKPVVDRIDPQKFWLPESEVKTLTVGILNIRQETSSFRSYREVITLSEINERELWTCRDQTYHATRQIQKAELGLGEAMAHTARVTGGMILDALRDRRPGRGQGPKRRR